MTNTTSRTAELSNPQRIIFPGHSKQDLVDYYKGIAGAMLPHISGRPLTLYRFPHGATERGFYQKNRPEFYPDWVRHKVIGGTDYIVCDSRESLVYVGAQVAEFHISTSRAGKAGYPDKIVFDLDPAEKDLALLRRTARKVGRLLEEIGLSSYVMTTGKAGYHVAAPIKPEQENDKVRDFALKVARVIEADNPERITTELNKEQRAGRLFMDVNRNSRNQTSIAPYSVRATEKAAVAMPVGWDELKDAAPSGFDIASAIKRKKPDAWGSFDSTRVSLRKAVEALKR